MGDMGSFGVCAVIGENATAAAEACAKQILKSLQEALGSQPHATLAVSGGTSPKMMFAEMAKSAFDWSRVHLFWVDERCVPPDNAESNFRMTREALLDHVPLQPHQIHRMEGELEPEVAAARYESTLRSTFRLEGAEWPRFDLVALGMGPDGHTASLFPHTAALHETTRLVVANHVPQMNTWRITLTWPVINNASSVFFLIAGADKAEILNEVLTGPRDVERLPSQLIWPLSGILTLILDKAAAALLPATDGEGCGFLERDR